MLKAPPPPQLSRRLLASALLLVTGATPAYYLGRLSQPDYLSATDRLPTEYFTDPTSFSEAENAKAAVAGLSAEFLTNWRGLRVAEVRGLKPRGSAPSEQSLRRGIEEFKDAPGELPLRTELLRLLRQKKALEPFLEEYLLVVYQFPGSPQVVEFAEAAAVAAEATGRNDDLARALQFQSLLPAALQAPELVRRQQEIAIYFARLTRGRLTLNPAARETDYP